MNVHNSVQVVFQRKMTISSQSFACMECCGREGERAGLTQQLFARQESLAKESKRTRSIASSTRLFIELEIRSSVEVEAMKNSQILCDLEAIKYCKNYFSRTKLLDQLPICRPRCGRSRSRRALAPGPAQLRASSALRCKKRKRRIECPGILKISNVHCKIFLQFVKICEKIFR